MNITVIGTRADKSLMGEDADGKLYIGTKKLVGYEALTRVVADGQVEYRYGDEVRMKGTANENEANSSAICEKQYKQVTVIREVDGNEVETQETREVKVEVIDWEAA